ALAELRHRKLAIGKQEHGKYVLRVSDLDGVEVLLAHQREQSQQSAPLVDLLGDDRGVQVGLADAEAIRFEGGDQIPDQHRRHRHGHAALVRVGAYRVLVTIVQEHAGDLAKGGSDPLELLERGASHQHALASTHGVPDDRSVLGHPADESLRRAVLLTSDSIRAVSTATATSW